MESHYYRAAIGGSVDRSLIVSVGLCDDGQYQGCWLNLQGHTRLVVFTHDGEEVFTTDGCTLAKKFAGTVLYSFDQEET